MGPLDAIRVHPRLSAANFLSPVRPAAARPESFTMAGKFHDGRSREGRAAKAGGHRPGDRRGVGRPQDILPIRYLATVLTRIRVNSFESINSWSFGERQRGMGGGDADPAEFRFNRSARGHSPRAWRNRPNTVPSRRFRATGRRYGAPHAVPVPMTADFEKHAPARGSFHAWRFA